MFRVFDAHKNDSFGFVRIKMAYHFSCSTKATMYCRSSGAIAMNLMPIPNTALSSMSKLSDHTNLASTESAPFNTFTFWTFFIKIKIHIASFPKCILHSSFLSNTFMQLAQINLMAKKPPSAQANQSMDGYTQNSKGCAGTVYFYFFGNY